jgi:hypothetical protein
MTNEGKKREILKKKLKRLSNFLTASTEVTTKRENETNEF